MSSEYKCSTHPCLIGVTPQMSVKPNPTNDRILAMTSSEEIELLKQTLMQEEIIDVDSKLI